MALRREKVILAPPSDEDLRQFAAHFARVRHVMSSLSRNDRARRESPLYAADPKLAGPQVWGGDDS